MGQEEALLSWPSKENCRSWTCCPESSAACRWTGCADRDRPAGGDKPTSAHTTGFLLTRVSVTRHRTACQPHLQQVY